MNSFSFSAWGEAPLSLPGQEGTSSVADKPGSRMDTTTRNDKIKALFAGSPTTQRMFTNLTPYVILQMRVCNLVHCIPYTWDGQSGRVCLKKSKPLRIWSQVQVWIHGIYAITALTYLLLTLKLNKMSTKLLGFVFLSCIMVTVVMRQEFWRSRKDVIKLWSTFLDMESKYIDASAIKKHKKDPMSLVMICLGICTSFGLPGFMMFLLLVDPCKPPGLGYMLFKVGYEKCAIPAWPIRLTLLAFDTWMWAISISAACFFVFHCFFLGLRIMDMYLRLLRRGFSLQRDPKVFSSTSEKESLCFELYNELQILARLYNRVHQSYFIPSLVATAVFVIIICLYTCIRLHSVIPMPGFAFFPLLSSDGFSVIFVTRIASMVYQQSHKLVTLVTKNAKHGRKAWFRKKANSLDQLKIRFGSANFIDETTPLVFLDFAFSQTVSLMLLT